MRNNQTSVTIYSREFIEAVGLKRRGIVLRPVTFNAGKGKDYFEIEAKGIEPCGVRAFEAMDIRKGFQCRKCHRRQAIYIVPKLAALTFIARDDLPAGDIVLVQDHADSGSVTICVREAKWKQLRAKPGLKGIVSGSLGIVPASEVERSPQLALA